MVTLPPILDMSVHTHLEVSAEGWSREIVRWNREVTLLTPVDLMDAWLIAQSCEGAEYADLLFKVHSSEAHLAQVPLLVQRPNVLLNLRELDLLALEVV